MEAHAYLVWYTAWLSLGSAAVAAYMGHTHLVFVPATVWLTSILHWSNPQSGWRHTLDVWTVRVVLLWQIWYALWMRTGIYYFLITAMGILLYLIGWDLHTNGLHKEGMIYHCGLHLLANMANIVLYVGS